MIEEVVNSILEAEDAADKKIAQARKQASDIVAEAESKAEQQKKQQAASNKVHFAQKSREIEAEADAEAKKTLQQLNEQTDKEMESYRKNVDEAVKIILESL